MSETDDLRSNPPLPPRLVTHRSCMDGSMCAVVFRCLHRDAEVLFVAPHEAEDVPDRDAYATIFADVCPRTLRPHEAVLDHHASSYDRVEGPGFLGFYSLDTARCGCRMLFDHLKNLHPGEAIHLERLRDLVDVVDDYDRYQLRFAWSKPLARIHEFFGQARFVDSLTTEFWVTHNRRHTNPVGQLWIPREWRDLDDILQERESDYVRRIVGNSWTATVELDGRGVIVACVFAEESVNSVADALLVKHRDAGFAMVVNTYASKVSLRSRDPQYDCVTLARSLSDRSGGHRGSAGFPFSDEMIVDIRAVIGDSR